MTTVISKSVVIGSSTIIVPEATIFSTALLWDTPASGASHLDKSCKSVPSKVNAAEASNSGVPAKRKSSPFMGVLEAVTDQSRVIPIGKTFSPGISSISSIVTEKPATLRSPSFVTSAALK